MIHVIQGSSGKIETVTALQLDPSYVLGPVISAVVDALKSSAFNSDAVSANALRQIENMSVRPFSARTVIGSKGSVG